MAGRAAAAFDAREREQWRLPAGLTVSQWAELYRELPARSSSVPGRYSCDLTPYARDVMDAFNDDSVEEVTVMKSVQVGMTEVALNILGYMVDEDPSPTLYVMPTENDIRGIAAARLRQMIDLSDRLSLHKTDALNDLRGILWSFDNMDVKFGWSDSDASLASMPCRVAILDELAKYHNSKTKIGADRVDLARKRTQTFWNRKIIKLSTPEDETDLLVREYRSSDQRRLWVPCPHCGTYAPLVFPRDGQGHRFHYPDVDAEEIRRGGLAYFECVSCAAPILEKHRRAMVAAGVFCPEGNKVAAGGVVVGGMPSTAFRGFHIWSAYSPFVPWGSIAYEWITSQSDLEKLKSFVNNTLGEPWEEKAKHVEVDRLRESVGQLERGVVPARGRVLTMAADVQADYLLYEVRAWAGAEENWLVQYGRVETFGELAMRVLEHQWPVEQGQGATKRIQLALVDSGHRQDEVYAFCRQQNKNQRREVVRPSKGVDRLRGGAPYQLTGIDKDFAGKPLPGSTQLCSFVNLYFKDRLARLMQPDSGKCHLPAEVGEDWFVQITSEHKVTIRKGGLTTKRWVLKPHRTENHYWDCAVMNLVAADLLGLHWRFPAQPSTPDPKPTPSPSRDAATRPSPWVRRNRKSGRRGWI